MQKHLPFIILLLVITVALVFLNYHQGTWLSGWDALHPEFNFPLNFKRLIFGVIREEQGLGAIAAQAHMADLPRVVVLWLLSFVIPLFFLRYFFIGATLVLGVMGAYFFISQILIKEKRMEGAAFLGALFYLFNLGTIQQFIVIQEMFAVHFAALPWLFLAASSYLLRGKTIYLALFALVTLLSTPQAHTPTLWYAFMLVFAVYLGFFLKEKFRKVVALLIVTLLVNAFWLLPNAYFVLSGQALKIQEAKINKIFSEEAFLHNQSYGNILDLLVFKNFLFDWLIYAGNATDSYEPLLKSWQGHLSNLGILGIGYIGAALVLVGVILAIKSKNIFTKALLLPLLLSAVFLLNNTTPFTSIFAFLQESMPLFKEALRFPFTKFSILLVFFSACFFSLTEAKILAWFSGKRRRFWGILQTSIVALSLIIYAWPSFRGELISGYLQVKIPAEYFQMFEWFKAQPEGRIAQLPVHSFWGWIYYDWGFQGAQFISFGLKQPLLERDFDRWNLSNEQAFRELSYAVYSQDINLLENVLKKYQVSFIILDKNILAPGKGQDKRVLFFNEIESLLQNNSKSISKAKEFGKISVYQTSFKGSLFRAPGAFTKVFLPGGVGEVDWAYQQVGDYISGEKDTSVVSFPYSSLSDNQNFASMPTVVPPAVVKDYLRSENVVPAEFYAEGGRVVLGGITNRFDGKPGANWLVNLDRETLSLKNLPEKELKNYGQLFLSTKTVNNLYFYTDEAKDWKKQDYQLTGNVEICGEKAPGQSSGFIDIDPQTFKIVSKNTSACVYLPLRQFIGPENLSSARNLVRVSFEVSKSSSKAGARFCFYDHLAQRCTGERKVMAKEGNTFYLPIIPSDIDRWELVFFADNAGNTKAEEVIFKQFEVVVNKAKDFWTITPEDIREGNFDLSAALNLAGIKILGLEHQVEDCASGLQVPKSTIRAIDDYIEYSSLGGSSCGYFSFPALPHNIGYVLSFEAQNITGLPLRLCAANLFSKRCDVFSSLPKNNNFGENTILIPPMGDGGLGYDIHFNNYSVGSIPTVNLLRNLKITPFPYYYLTQLNSKPKDKEAAVLSALNIKSVKEVWPQFYIVDVENPSTQSGLLVLDRAFEKGWWASEGRHVLANSWANGWIIEGGEGGKIYIFFWPQLLEFLGFVILGGTTIFLFKRRK